MNELIQWPKAKYWDTAWNPMIGCKWCSDGCDNCYAKGMAKRFGMSFEPHEGKDRHPPKKGVVFCGNMTDLFGEWVTDREDYVRRSIGNTDKATYLWLTKRPSAMCETLTRGRAFPQGEKDEGLPFSDIDFKNQYFGFTAEKQELYDRRRMFWTSFAPKWANLWISAEPLLGRLNLRFGEDLTYHAPVKWVVVGCESGPNRRGCRIEWIEDIVEQCRKAGVPVFVKQICDAEGRCETNIDRFPETLRVRQVPWIAGQS